MEHGAWECPCGAPNALARGWCGRCGSARGRPCPRCGFGGNLEGDLFCGGCGAALESKGSGSPEAVSSLAAPLDGLAPSGDERPGSRIEDLEEILRTLDQERAFSTVDTGEAMSQQDIDDFFSLTGSTEDGEESD